MRVDTTYLHGYESHWTQQKQKVENRWESLPDSPPSAALPRGHVQRPNDTTPDRASSKDQLKNPGSTRQVEPIRDCGATVV
jgi:hypothetical protein